MPFVKFRKVRKVHKSRKNEVFSKLTRGSLISDGFKTLISFVSISGFNHRAQCIVLISVHHLAIVFVCKKLLLVLKCNLEISRSYGTVLEEIDIEIRTIRLVRIRSID